MKTHKDHLTIFLIGLVLSIVANFLFEAFHLHEFLFGCFMGANLGIWVKAVHDETKQEAE